MGAAVGDDAEVAVAATLPRPDTIANIFPDAGLATAVADELGVTVGTVVTQADLDGVLELHARDLGIQNLEGMQYLVNIQDLVLGGNYISNLQPLAELVNVQRLELWDNVISNLQPLAELINLQRLILSVNQISDLQPLAGLVSLERLSLSINQASNLQPLAGLVNLEYLALNDNQVSDLRPLAGLSNLEWIRANGQQITLPSTLHANPLTVENAVFGIDGARIVPDEISHNGAYIAPHVQWGSLSINTKEVSYSFEQVIGHIDELRFSGTVVQPLTITTPFADVHPTNWFFPAVRYVFYNNLMQGTSPTTFAPNANLSRAMIATILHRMAGEPEVTYRPVFSDVAAGRWYSDAIIWAFDADVVRGTSPTTFAPGSNITREQFAAMMHRFAEYMEYDTTVRVGSEWNRFRDSNQISIWAINALAWANYHGLITGRTSTTIAPRGTATRAEAAMILMRFMETFED